MWTHRRGYPWWAALASLAEPIASVLLAVLAATMVNCWHAEPAKRPAFSALVLSLDPAAAAQAEQTGGVCV